jgi:hypothetical protein
MDADFRQHDEGNAINQIERTLHGLDDRFW